jgi:hypothetical protein
MLFNQNNCHVCPLATERPQQFLAVPSPSIWLHTEAQVGLSSRCSSWFIDKCVCRLVTSTWRKIQSMPLSTYEFSTLCRRGDYQALTWRPKFFHKHLHHNSNILIIYTLKLKAGKDNVFFIFKRTYTLMSNLDTPQQACFFGLLVYLCSCLYCNLCWNNNC